MKKKNWSIVIIACVVMLVLFAYFGGRMAAAEPAFSFAEEPCEVYLTFDDGPSTVVTNRILDTLAEENVKAAFFIVGERVPGREETLRRIAREGHTLGVHSMTHRYREIYASPEAFLNDVNGCAEVIRKTTGVEPKFYRFPGGGKHEAERALLADLGYTVVSWNAVCGDAEGRDACAEELAQTAASTSQGKRRVVLLMHDGALNAATAEALPEIIRFFRGQGYVFRAF